MECQRSNGLASRIVYSGNEQWLSADHASLARARVFLRASTWLAAMAWTTPNPQTSATERKACRRQPCTLAKIDCFQSVRFRRPRHNSIMVLVLQNRLPLLGWSAHVTACTMSGSTDLLAGIDVAGNDHGSQPHNRDLQRLGQEIKVLQPFRISDVLTCTSSGTPVLISESARHCGTANLQ